MHQLKGLAVGRARNAGIALALATLAAAPSARAQLIISKDAVVYGTYLDVSNQLVIVSGPGDPTLTVRNLASVFGWEGRLLIGASNGESGNLRIFNGSSLTLTGSDFTGFYEGAPTFTGDLAIGVGRDSSGHVLVSGADSMLNTTQLKVGIFGNGELELNDGGYITHDRLEVGYYRGSTGVVNISGSGTRMQSRTVSIGGYGTGTVNVADGAVWDIGSNMILGWEDNTAGGPGAATINVTGSGSRLIAEFTDLAYDVTSTINITEGAYARFYSIHMGKVFGGRGILNIDGADSTVDVYYLGIGMNGTGELNITNGGRLTTTSMQTHLGHSASLYEHGTGNVLVSGTGSNWEARNDLYVGYYGTGNLTVENGGNVSTSGNLYLGYHEPAGMVFVDSKGTVTITGDQSRLSTVLAHIGHYRYGELNVSDGGVLTSSSSYLGTNIGSTGVAKISGGSWTVDGRLSIGEQGSGTLNISDGGTVSSGVGTIGFSGSSTGEVSVSTGGSWTVDGQLYVGLAGDGTLNITSGGVVSTNNIAYVGTGAKSNGTLTVDGAGSRFQSADLVISDMGRSILTIQNGGVVNSTNVIVGERSWEAASAAVTVIGQASALNSSKLEVGKEGTGTITVQSGGKLTSSEATIAVEPGSSGSVTVSGQDSVWDAGTSFGTSLHIGRGGHGTLSISDGATVSSFTGSVGTLAGAHGIVNVSGADSEWNIVSALNIGQQGKGELNILSGGQVTNASVRIGGGNPDTPASTATVSGPGSIWSTYDMYVGYSSPAEMTISDGGQVVTRLSSNGSIAVGDVSAKVTVTGSGSLWAVNNLNVGLAGHGELNIEDGGLVTANTAYIARSGNTSSGVANVTGTGSQWQIAGDFFVGDMGTGDLNISAGGSVYSGNSSLGPSYDSLGRAVVSGEDSIWSISGDLNLGGDGYGVIYYGTGELTIGSGGKVTVSGATRLLTATSAINLQEGGTLVTGTLDTSTGTFNWTGGTLDITGSASGNVSVPALGVLGGVGTIAGSVVNAGTVSPGNSPGILTITGDYVQDPAGVLAIELGGVIAGTGYDQLRIDGNATLGGTLEVQLLEGFTLTEGMEFQIISVGGDLQGTFAGLAQNARVGVYDGVELFIHYNHGSSGGVTLYTGAIPEPAALMVVGMSSIMLLRRQRKAPSKK